MSRNGKTRSALKIKHVSSQLELVQVFTIRIRVFVREQRVPAEIELDTDDQRGPNGSYVIFVFFEVTSLPRTIFRCAIPASSKIFPTA